MAGMKRMMRTTGSAVVIVFGLIAAAGAVRAESGVADIQWAQRVLTEKGFDIGGRADGRMTPPTRAALKKYQAASGLPLSGELDAATIEKMMAGRPAKPGVGALSVPKPGSRVVERDEKPRAAPTTRVGTEGGGDVVNPAIVAGVPQGAGDFNPDRPTAAGSPATGEQLPLGRTDPSRRSATDWLRPLLATILAGVLAGIGGLWWMSGRRRRPTGDEPRTRRATVSERMEPTFDDAPVKKGSIDEPPLRAEPNFERATGPRAPATTAKHSFSARPLMSEGRRPV